MVRAGENARLFGEFKKQSIIAIGWDGVGDLTSVNTQKEVKDLTKEVFKNEKPGYINIVSGQINRFRFEFKEDDYVATYSPEDRVYLVGQITGQYVYNKSSVEYHHTRKVKWLGEVSRDLLSTSTKNTLGAISTIFEIGNDAKDEIINLVGKTKSEPTNVDLKNIEIKSDDELDVLKNDIKIKAHEFIKDQLLKLSWDDMQRLVAGILMAMGYKTRISPVGPDRGRDVIASRDGLGLEDPRIVVEVKHRNGQMGASEIRSFTGGLRAGHKGLYVSSGGFTKEAKYEAERSNIPLTLINLDELVDLIVQYYDQFDSETRILIPLTKIYWPE